MKITSPAVLGHEIATFLRMTHIQNYLCIPYLPFTFIFSLLGHIANTALPDSTSNNVGLAVLPDSNTVIYQDLVTKDIFISFHGWGDRTNYKVAFPSNIDHIKPDNQTRLTTLN